ncbi:MAG: pseudouridine synthase [Clostridiaceae bacterium]
MERLDKILSNTKLGSRKEVKEIIKKGRVTVDGTIVKASDMLVDKEASEIKVDGVVLNYKKYIYLVMNKPGGVLSATEDNFSETVIDLLDEKYRVYNPFPVGRLDKDTTGLLLLTNDGDLNHRLISPKWEIDKKYHAVIERPITSKDIEKFAKGIVISEGYRCRPAGLRALAEDGKTCEVIIHEGKFHQVKRMFEALDNKVLELKRESFGPLDLPLELNLGEYRELTDMELDMLLKATDLEK